MNQTIVRLSDTKEIENTKEIKNTKEIEMKNRAKNYYCSFYDAIYYIAFYIPHP